MAKEDKIIKKKSHIIDALKRCLENNVYSQISLEDVAHEAGLSKGGLRHYFPTREELYMDLIDGFFNQIHRDHIEVMKGLDLDKNDKAFISTLFGIERFLMNKNNIKIFINILLYGFEDDKIMERIKTFFRNDLALYTDVIREFNPGNEKGEEEIRFIGRISQIILLCAGIFESIDPIKMETPALIEHLMKCYKD